MPGMRWDIHCHVVDNLGDVGVCWRLAADLAARGEAVRLLIDDASALSVMAPQGAAGVTVLPWGTEEAGDGDGDGADVVIEAFGCNLPLTAIASMQRRAAGGSAPVWINLEYLSAEAYVERSHGLPSPQSGGLVKWFFFPGFGDRTGGLLRESGLETRHAAFDARAWLAALGCEPRPGERIVSLFCYANTALPALLRDLARQPTLLLLTPGWARDQVQDLLPEPPKAHLPQGHLQQGHLQQGHSRGMRADSAGLLRLHPLPWLSQTDFDHLLWSCNLNLVRGEDSLVRAIWAGVPFVWQAYPQHDQAHHAKVEALIERLELDPSVAALWRAWNGMPTASAGRAWPGLPPLQVWSGSAAAAGRTLRQPTDLTSRLRDFVALRRHLAKKASS
ncbi:MAG: elongation factor P maturation arginine rhamnosyltransferase EarP [Rubrivivax sp.]